MGLFDGMMKDVASNRVAAGFNSEGKLLNEEEKKEQQQHIEEKKRIIAERKRDSTPVRAIVLGVREAENKASYDNTTYNSSYYSLMIECFDGSRHIVEGDAKAITPYLPLIDMTSNDMLLKKIEERLQSIETKLGKNL